MLLWHAGATLWLFRWIFRDPKVDVRFLLLGVVVPDAVDLAVGTLVFPDFSTGELYFHTLSVPVLLMVVGLVATRRGPRRRAVMAVGIGWLFHLLLDGMWIDSRIFFWPFFGWALPHGVAPFWPHAWQRALHDPWRWLLEAAGLVYLVRLWFALGLNRRARRTEMLHTGRLPGYVTGNA